MRTAEEEARNLTQEAPTFGDCKERARVVFQKKAGVDGRAYVQRGQGTRAGL